MEAVLDFRRGCQDLAIILMGEYGGGRKWERRPAALLLHLEGGVRKGRGEGGERESKYVLALNAAMCTKFPLYLSFSCLRSAVAASLDIKKFHGNDTRVYFTIFL
jgi:hypothetical protein